MAVEPKTQRQRFYVELVPGETTIVSWKKLTRKAKEKNECPHVNASVVGSLTGTYSSSSAHETPKRVLDGCSESVQCSDSYVRSERLESKNKVTLSGYKQQRKRRAEMTAVKGVDTYVPPSTKRRRMENMSRKAAAVPLLDKSCSDPGTSAIVKDHQLNQMQASAADAPLLTYTKKVARSSSKHGCPPSLNAVMDASVFPLKTRLSDLLKTEKVCLEQSRMKVGIHCSEKSRMEVGLHCNSSDAMRQNSAVKCSPLEINPRFNPRCRSLVDGEKVEASSKSQHRHSEKSFQSRELVDIVSPGFGSPLQHLVSMKKRASSAVNDATSVRTSSTVLEKAIRELEKTVAESKSFKIEASDAHTSWSSIVRELPLEVEMKLGEVANIMMSSQEKVSEDVITFLVNIIGKLVHGKTSKKVLRKVIMVKLYPKMEKAVKFKEIKDEILSMVANRSSNQQGADNSDVKGEILAKTYKLNYALEDKLCDLYDLCVQGLDGDKGVQVHKLFMQLSELWPKGAMDHHRIRDAISRAKSRRGLADKNQGQKATQSGQRVDKVGINRKADPFPGSKREVTNSGASHKLITPPARKTNSIKQKLAKGRNLIKAETIPPMKEQKKQLVPEKTNVKVRFSLKNQTQTQTETQTGKHC